MAGLLSVKRWMICLELIRARSRGAATYEVEFFRRWLDRLCGERGLAENCASGSATGRRSERTHVRCYGDRMIDCTLEWENSYPYSFSVRTDLVNVINQPNFMPCNLFLII